MCTSLALAYLTYSQPDYRYYRLDCKLMSNQTYGTTHLTLLSFAVQPLFQWAYLLSARWLAAPGSDVCLPVADERIPGQGIKVVCGQGKRQGEGVFTAVFQELEKLRRNQTLISKIVVNKPLPGRTAASMQVWLLHPDQDRYSRYSLLPAPRASSACTGYILRSRLSWQDM